MAPIGVPEEPKPFGQTLPTRTPAEQCRARGGTWDTATNTCIMPEEEPAKRGGGRPIGLLVGPKGEQFTGVSPEERRGMTALGKGFIDPKADRLTVETAQRRQELLAAEQQRKLMEIPGVKELMEQQAKEMEELATPEGTTPTSATRSERAGAAFLTSAMRFGSEFAPVKFGGEERIAETFAPSKLDFERMDALSKSGLIVVGKLTSIKIPILGSANKLFNPSVSATIGQRAADAGEITAQSDRINQNAWRKGGNIALSIIRQEELEESLKVRYNDMLILLDESPEDQLQGLDVFDAMRRDQTYIVGNRQALELYQKTGDLNQLKALGLAAESGLAEAGIPLEPPQ